MRYDERVRKFLLLFFIPINLILGLLIFPVQVFAADNCTATYSPPQPIEGQPFTVTIYHAQKNNAYNVWLAPQTGRNINPDNSGGARSGPDNDQTIEYTFSNVPAGAYELHAVYPGSPARFCLGEEKTVNVLFTSASNTENVVSNSENPTCVAWVGENRGITPILNPGETSLFRVIDESISSSKSYQVIIDEDTYDSGFTILNSTPPEFSFRLTTNKKDGKPLAEGSHVVTLVEKPTGFLSGLYKAPTTLCSASFGIGYIGAPEMPPEPTNPVQCGNVSDNKCTSVNTVIGSIGTEPESFISTIFGLLLGLSGGVALLLIIVSGYRLMVSQGNPDAVKEAREQLTAAIIGLLFMILSFVILQVIGVNILRIPGFG